MNLISVSSLLSSFIQVKGEVKTSLPVRLWDVEVPTFSSQSAHRWRWGCTPYAPTILTSRKFHWVEPRVLVRLEGLGKWNECCDIQNRNLDLPASSKALQPTTLSRSLPPLTNLVTNYNSNLATSESSRRDWHIKWRKSLMEINIIFKISLRSLRNIIMVIRWKTMAWTRSVAHAGMKRNATTILIHKP
jgi:hypothetical protein